VKRLLLVSTLALVSSLVTIAACKQGEDERCQVNDDCTSPLVCNKATNTCQSSTGGGIDADVIDAVPADAAVDAVPDAP
jgi:hypothetical protein